MDNQAISYFKNNQVINQPELVYHLDYKFLPAASSSISFLVTAKTAPQCEVRHLIIQTALS